MEKVDITIIGAGVVGLAVATTLAECKKSIFLLERHSAFGQETSSRNSEVIHAGIYYPKGSLKAKLCVEGNRLLYEICEANKIPYRRITKVIVASNKAELAQLEALSLKGDDNGVPGLKLITRDELKELEPNVAGIAALFSPNTGIIDVHSLMKYLADKAKFGGAEISYGSNVKAIKKISGGYELLVGDEGGEDFSFVSEVVINCAGLESDQIVRLVGIDAYELKLCKGDYFSVSGGKGKLIERLVYPIPHEQNVGLGVHATLNLQGELRLGPDTTYISRDEMGYDIDPAKAAQFYQAAKKLLPFIELNDLSPDTSGIRPKLQGPNDPVADFVVCEEKDKGYPGFINLIGIESPGLTAAPAIAKMVKDLL
ncbi:NAD(P)/FAD-dependent oxidoreductase [Candidatus Saganbacteria bacterium CG08_land_8_20_14_0_20_45_16]|uniref:NAD(P)/FAD-dependent oxidoreductase n=1 Tax=Candidatus Saganbacteria bacterium CG08_land_8_20_14_0_20_45_16 TaxID=2014293 RepID=A0A2H0XYR6_UNCSA|nr:MAG: NAD(P)/FAD-dependent oxidoreductase [Candidatus Saganbacteria bacterium CG08_land_8_20_14_0_20_45_16]